MIQTDVAKILLFYIPFFVSSLFIFSFLFSLTLRFLLSSPCTGSLSLQPVRDVHRQRRWRSSDNDSALRHTRSQPRSISPISPSSLSFLSAFHSTFLWLWGFFFFFFFFAAIWVDLMVVVGYGDDDWWWLLVLLMGCLGWGYGCLLWNLAGFAWVCFELCFWLWWMWWLCGGVCWQMAVDCVDE